MKLNKIEKEIIKKFFYIEKIAFSNQNNFEQIEVLQRIYTGTGFITYIDKSIFLKIKNKKKLQWGKIGAKINNNVDVGFLIYIDEGYITTIEGYTYDEKWPDEIKKIDFYKIKES